MMKKRNRNKNSSIFLKEENKEKIDIAIDDDIAQGIDIVNRNKEELDNQRNERINKFSRNANGKMLERVKVRYQISSKTILFICLFVILAVWILYDYGPIFGIHINNNYTKSVDEIKIELVTKDNDIYGMYNEELYVFSNNTITTYNSNSEITWSYTFSDNFTPNIYIKEKYILVTNNSTGIIYLFENKNEILNKKVDGVIKNSFIDKYGNVALEYSNTSGYNNIISVFDKRGKSKYDAYLSQENIISLEMLEDANKIVISEAITDSSSIGVKFRIIDISKEESEQIRDIVSLDNQFIYDFIIEGKDIYALLDNKIIKINIDNGNVTLLKDFNSAQMLFVALNESYFTYLERNLQDNKYIAENINYDGTKISSTYIDSVPKSMISSNFINYYVYQDHIYILNKWGVELRELEIDFTPKKCIVFNNNKSLALIYTNKIYIVNL